MAARLILTGVVFVYACLIIWAYTEVVSPAYSYLSYVVVDRPLIHIVVGLLLAVTPALWISTTIRRPSSFVCIFLFVVVYIPYTTVGILSTSIEITVFVLSALAMAVSLFLLSTVERIPILRVPRPSLSPLVFWIIFGSVASLLGVVVVNGLGIPSRIPSLLAAHDTRMEYRSASTASVAYSIIWLAKVVGPLLLSLGVTRRRRSYFLIGALVQVAVFALAGWKSAIFAALIVVGASVLVSRWRFHAVIIMVLAASGIIVVGMLWYGTSGDDLVLSVFFRRMIATPGLLTAHYVEFFSVNPKAMLGHSVFSSVAPTNYYVTPAFIIGEHVFGRETTSANANVWADAFANFGVIGILVFSVLLSGVLWLFDSVSRVHGLQFGTAFIAISAFSLSDTGLMTTLATHGLLLAILLLILMPRQRQSGKYRRGYKVL